MKEVFFAICMYPFVLAEDIWLFFHSLFANIKYSFSKPQFSYEDIVQAELYYDYIIDSDFIIFCEDNNNNKTTDEYTRIISLDKNKFNELKSFLKENRLLDYKKYIFNFSLTPFWYLLVGDAGRGEESLTIKFNNGQTFNTTSYCTSKRFDIVVKYLMEIVESEDAKNRCNIQEVQKENIKKDGFQWVH